MRNIKVLLLFGIVCIAVFSKVAPQKPHGSLLKNTVFAWEMLLPKEIDFPKMIQYKPTQLAYDDKFLENYVWTMRSHDFGRVYSPT
jgi:hypothetical protein